MKKNYFKASSSVLKKYLVSFLLVFIVPSIVVILFFNSYTTNIINKQAERELQTRFTDSYKSVEQRLGDAINILIQACVDGDTNSLAYVKELDIDTIMKMKDYSEKILQYYKFNSFISNLIVYYKNNDIVITDRGKDSFYFYFNQFFNLNGIDSDQFKNILQGVNYREVVPIKNITVNKVSSKKVITIVQSFPINSSSPTGSIVLSLDEDALIKMMNPGNKNGNDCFMMIDNQGNILTKRGNINIKEETISNIIKSDSKIIRKQKINDKYMTVFLEKSSLNDWWYLYILPEEEMESSVASFKKLLIEVIVIFILSGLAMSVLFSLINYSPIRTIVKEITAKDNKKFKGANNKNTKYNEYNLIKNYIDELFLEKNTLDSKVNIFVNDVKSNFLRELIIDGYNKDKFLNTSKLLNIKFENPYYCFICIELGEYENIDSEDLNKSFYIFNEITDFLNRLGNSYMFGLDKNKMGIIVNIEGTFKMEHLSDSYTSLINTISRNYSASIRVGIGKIYEGYDCIPISYRESLEALRYSAFYNIDMCAYNDLDKEHNTMYFYPPNFENKLINALESGEIKSVEDIVNDVLIKNFIDRKLSFNSAYTLYCDMMGTINKVVIKTNIKLTYSGTEDEESMPNMEVMKSFEDMKNSIINYCRAVCAHLAESKEQSIEGLANDVIKYINENYNHPNLSCSFLADKFNISQSYLSNVVKKHVGMNYGDYVNYLRIESAKLLLRENNLNIAEIATKLGYSSSNSFIRTFKSFEGITPGQYGNAAVGKKEGSSI